MRILIQRGTPHADKIIAFADLQLLRKIHNAMQVKLNSHAVLDLSEHMSKLE